MLSTTFKWNNLQKDKTTIGTDDISRNPVALFTGKETNNIGDIRSVGDSSQRRIGHRGFDSIEFVFNHFSHDWTSTYTIAGDVVLGTKF